ncbi:MAG: acetoin utilization protein AcuC [Rhizobiaceae bacterium]
MALPPLFISSEIYRKTGYGTNHPLAIQRVGTVLDLCDAMGWFDDGLYIDSYVASESDLIKFHTAEYVKAIREADRSGRVTAEVRKRYKIGTMENPFFQGLYQRASTSAGGSIQAAKLCTQGHVVYHPSGGTHHGMPNYARGFCYFNDIVLAIIALLECGLERIVYLDLDAHHGDGVQFAFETDPRVFTISIHEENRWPNSGLLEDRGNGNARNLSVPSGFSDSELAFAMNEAVLPMISKFQPEAAVICCGADALAGDPLSRLSLTNIALWNSVGRIVNFNLPTVIVGGGGYNPWTVARCWAGLWASLSGYEIPKTLPESAQNILSNLDSDLIDEEDIEDQWITTIADTAMAGRVRERVKDVARAVVAAE